MSARLRDSLKSLTEDAGAARAFAQNPAGTMLEQLYPERAESFPPARLSAANRLIYSAVRNPEFTRRVSELQDEINRRLALPENVDRDVPEIVSREEVVTRLADALLAAGDRELLKSFLDHVGQASPPQSRDIVYDDVAVVSKAVVAVIVVITAIDVTPRPATPLDLGVSSQQLRALAESITRGR